MEAKKSARSQAFDEPVHFFCLKFEFRAKSADDLVNRSGPLESSEDRENGRAICALLQSGIVKLTCVETGQARQACPDGGADDGDPLLGNARRHSVGAKPIAERYLAR